MEKHLIFLNSVYQLNQKTKMYLLSADVELTSKKLFCHPSRYARSCPVSCNTRL